MDGVQTSVVELTVLVAKAGDAHTNDSELCDVAEKMMTFIQNFPKLDNNRFEHRTIFPQVEQIAVSLWNIAVAKKTAGILSAKINAQLKHVACILMNLCTTQKLDETTAIKQFMMALKTAKAWIDATQAEQALVCLDIASKCIEKRRTFIKRLPEAGDAQCASGGKRSALYEDVFKLHTYQAEAFAMQGDYERSLSCVKQAREILPNVPSNQSGFLSMLCYNMGVECSQKEKHELAVNWLRESFELGKQQHIVGPKNQARTLRLLAHCYLDWDSTAHWQTAQNAISLAESEHSHLAGAYLKVKILLIGKESEDNVKTAFEEMLRSPDMSVNLGLNTAYLMMRYEKYDLALDCLKKLSTHFKNSLELGRIQISQLECSLQARKPTDAQTIVEQALTGHNTGRPLDMNIKKRFHVLIWEQAAICFERKDFSEALQWYNYSLGLYGNSDTADDNLAKLQRNRASCLLALERFHEADEALTRAENCDAASPFTCYIQFKLALFRNQHERAIDRIRKMCGYAAKEHGSSEMLGGLISLAVQQAFDKGNPAIAMDALENLIVHSTNAQQTLTALRCLLRMRLNLLDQSPEDPWKELQSIRDCIKLAHEKLTKYKDNESAQIEDFSAEATWFMKMAWNMGLKCGEENFQLMYDFFYLCSQLQMLLDVNLEGLSRYKTCLLMTAALGLRAAESVSASPEKHREILVQVLRHVHECRNVCEQIQHMSKDKTVLDNRSLQFLVLYEFEAKARMAVPELDKVLEKAVQLPNAEPTVFEKLAALAVESPSGNKKLGVRALKVAIRRYMKAQEVDYNAVSNAFHSLLELVLQTSTCLDEAGMEEAWGYLQDACGIVAAAPPDAYPESEVVWMMTKAWNCGIHLFSATKYQAAAQWCEQAMKLLQHTTSMRVNYETQMTKVYSEIMIKLDGGNVGQ